VSTVQSDDTLSRAIQQTDLPALLEQLYPESRAMAGRAGRVKRAWVSDSQDFNASLKRFPDGVWHLHDFVNNVGHDAFSFLVDIVGLTKAQAAQKLIRDAGLEQSQTRTRPKPQPKLELKPTPDMPKDLRDWVTTWQRVGGVRVGLDGAKLETLNAFAVWLADALRPYRAQLERIAAGVILEHCIDAFNGITPRACACGKRWTSRLEMWDSDNNGKELSRFAYGCEPCGEVWTAHELENARAVLQGGERTWTHTI
jgi:hypothetical protein